MLPGAALALVFCSISFSGPVPAKADPVRVAQAAGTRSAARPAAAPIRAGSLLIENPWARATPSGAKVAGGYVRITNTGSEPDRLVGLSSAIAGRGEVHEMSVTEGVMRMRPVDRGIEIKPGATVELKPGGFHLMFMDLRSGLKEGATVSGTLVFDKAGPVEVTFQVGGLGAREAPSAGHSHH